MGPSPTATMYVYTLVHLLGRVAICKKGDILWNPRTRSDVSSGMDLLCLANLPSPMYRIDVLDSLFSHGLAAQGPI